MTILHISDTHCHHCELGDMPKADVLVHTGDFSNYGSEEEVLPALEWLMALPYKHIIFVAGNHDLCLYDAESIDGLPDNVHFLHNSGVVIDKVSFYGLTWTNPNTEYTGKFDVLISHEPPIGILDKEMNVHWGSAQVLDFVSKKQPKYHLFGHAHRNYGIVELGKTIYSNASLTNLENKICNAPRLLSL